MYAEGDQVVQCSISAPHTLKVFAGEIDHETRP